MVNARDFAGVLLVFTTLALGPVVVRVGIGNNAIQSVARAIASGEHPETIVLLRSIVRTTALLGVVLSIPVAALILATARPDLVAAVPLLGVALFFETIRMTASDVFTGLQMTRWSVAYSFQLRSVVVGTAFVVMALLGLHLSFTIILLVLVGINGLLSASAIVRLRTLLSGHARPAAPGGIRRLIRGSIPFFLVEAGLFVIGRGDIWVAARLLGPTAGSVYGAASTTAVQLAIPLSVAGLAIAPLAASLVHQGEVRTLERIARLMAAAALFATGSGFVAVFFFGRDLLRVAYGAEFAGGYPLLLVLAIGTLVAVGSGPCGMILLMGGWQGRIMKVVVLWAAFAVVALPVGALAGRGLGLAIASSAMTVGCNVHLLVECRRSIGISTLPIVHVRSIRETWRALREDPYQRAI